MKHFFRWLEDEGTRVVKTIRPSNIGGIDGGVAEEGTRKAKLVEMDEIKSVP